MDLLSSRLISLHCGYLRWLDNGQMDQLMIDMVGISILCRNSLQYSIYNGIMVCVRKYQCA